MGYKFFINDHEVPPPRGWSEPIRDWGMPSDLHEQWLRQDKKKIRIVPSQPINASVFEEAEVIHFTPNNLICAEK